MFDDTDIRHKLRQRYNRRFFIGIHVALLLLLLIAGRFLPVVGGLLTALVFLLLLPHALYVLYREYRDWLERRIDKELYRHQQAEMVGKRKRYPEAYEETPAFRLTDDGEIEPVTGDGTGRGYDQPYPVQTASRDHDASPSQRSGKPRRRGRKDDTDEWDVKPRRRGRKDDTDEWDVKRLLKKVKDILD
ncbi:MAG: hypothetical protein ACOCX3_03900 [Chloroflexota bacterium]